MNYRLTSAAALAVVLASFSLFTVIQGAGWLYSGAGAVAVVAAAGLVTRLTPGRATAVAGLITLAAVVPLLAWPSWLVRIGGLAIIAVVAGSAAWRRVLPAARDAVTYLAALLLYLNVVYAGPQSFGWLVPSVASMRHLSLLASQGLTERNYAPPVPGIHGIELLAAGGIGAIAILTDVLAVRAHAPAVAGLPLLVLFSVPVATDVRHAGFGLSLAFCLGIAGYLALLAADGRDRLRLWGRLVSVWQVGPEDDRGRGPDTRELAAAGRRIGLAAVAVAVVVPLVLPGLKEHNLFSRGAGPGAGDGQVAPPRPLVAMRSQLRESSPVTVLTYRTTAANPAEQYLQIYVLGYNADSNTWLPASRQPSTNISHGQNLVPTTGLSPLLQEATSQTTISIGKHVGYRSQLSYLPVPYAPQYLDLPDAGSDWQETNKTQMIYGYRSQAGLTYTVTSRTPEPTHAQLASSAAIPAGILGGYGHYAGPDQAALRKIARQVTAGARTPFARATALEAWFTRPGNFTYTVTGKLPGSVLSFLTTQRRGFCQQFAFAMAVLARLAGIPSRLAVGYTAGTAVGHRTWKVTTADAHAWPELYFAGLGWLRFEPTPNEAGAQGTATQPDYSAPAPVTTGPGSQSAGGGALGPAPVAVSGAASRVKPGGGTENAGGGAAAAHRGGFPVGLLVLLLAVAAISAPGLIRAATRRRRWRRGGDDAARAHAAWRELASDLTDYGFGGLASESPRALARRLSEAAGLGAPARAAVDRITAAEERACYARTPAAADSLRADERTVRRAVASSVSRSRRWQARLIPASTLGPVLAAARQAPDAFGWLDAAGRGMRRGARRRLRRRLGRTA